MQTNIIPLTGAKTRLLRPYDVMALTGLPYDTALALVKAHGIKFGRSYYITQEWLEQALEERRAMSHG